MNRLNQLVRSLNRTEKGYFRKYCKVHSNGKNHNYLKVFDVIEKSPASSDDDFIIKKLKDERLSRNYAVTKKYLFDQILKSLELYHGGKSNHSKIEWSMRKAELLYSKGLLNESLSALRQARKLAYRADEFPYILQIISFEKRIGGAYRYKGIYKKFKTLLDEELDVIEKIRNYNEIQNIYYRVFETIKKERALRTKKELRVLNRLVKAEILSDIKHAKTFRAKITFCATWTFYFDMIGDYEKAYDYAKKLVKIWEDNPIRIKESLDRYLAANQNFLNRCYRLNRYEEFPAVLEKLKRIKPPNKEMEVTFFEMLSHFEMLYINRIRDKRKALELFDQIEKGLEKYKSYVKTNYFNLFCYNICVELIAMGDCKAALLWANKVIHKQKIDIQQDLLRFLRLLYLLIHLELGNKSILEYELRSVIRNFEAEGKSFKFEKVFFEFIKKAIDQMHLGNLRKLCLEYSEKIKSFRDDKFESRVFEYFSFDTYLLAKAKGITLAELEEQSQAS